MKDKITELLNEYANDHIVLQLECYQMSSMADTLGFPGVSKWFLIQAQDEVLHTRKIYNYLIGREKKIKINVDKFKDPKDHEEDSILKLMTNYKKIKEKFVEKTNNFINEAKQENDYLTVKFLDWFLIDFFEEIEEVNDYIHRIQMSNGNLYKFDKDLSKRQEPDTLAVIPPYTQK